MTNEGLLSLIVALIFFFGAVPEIAVGVFKMLFTALLLPVTWPWHVWRLFNQGAAPEAEQWKPRRYSADSHPKYLLDREAFFDKYAILYGDGNPLPAGEYRGFTLSEHTYPSGTRQKRVTAYSFTKADGTNELGTWPDVKAAIDAIVDDTDWEKR